VRLLVLNLSVWIASGAVIGWWFARRDWQSLSPAGFCTRLRNWERRGFYERVLLVRRWKDRLPEAGTWFGGISKRSLPTASEGRLRRFAAESLRAERVHLSFGLAISFTATWNRGWWLVLCLVVCVVANLPCIVVARYNRLRLTHLA
jgi:glycosyl-4,4'-diaponeurosporenoate acyltransferase